MKTHWVIALQVLAYTLFLAGIGLIARPTNQEREFSDAYKALELGMTGSEVEVCFGAEPVFKCTFHGASVHYFEPPPPRTRWSDTRGKIDRTRYTDGAPITALDEMPDPYDHVVVAFDPDDRLIAYTHIGEELHVHTKARGRVDGASLLHLRPSDLGVTQASAEQVSGGNGGRRR